MLKNHSEATGAEVVVLTVIPIELQAARAALGLGEASYRTFPGGTHYYTGTFESQRLGHRCSVALGCIGMAGNIGAAGATADAIRVFRPQVLLLMGIAAGMRGKIKIGEVVFSERVVGYESAALVAGPEGSQALQPRPTMPEPSHRLIQDVTFYNPQAERLNQRFDTIGGSFPVAPAGQEEQYQKHVAASIGARSTTIASGEKLLRTPEFLRDIREHQHGRTDTGEMEAVGFAQTCNRERVDWLVIRGISDFGDEFKDDSFHRFASYAAATVLIDFLTYGLSIADAAAPPAQDARRAPAPDDAPDDPRDTLEDLLQRSGRINTEVERLALLLKLRIAPNPFTVDEMRASRPSFAALLRQRLEDAYGAGKLLELCASIRPYLHGEHAERLASLVRWLEAQR